MKRKVAKAVANLTNEQGDKLEPALNVRISQIQRTMLDVVRDRLKANNDSHAIRLLIERGFEEIVNGRFKI